MTPTLRRACAVVILALGLAAAAAATAAPVADPHGPGGVADTKAAPKEAKLRGGGGGEDAALLHKHMSDVLKSVDADKDGRISKDEVHKHLNKATLARMKADEASIVAKTPAKAKAHMTEKDGNKDGKLHFDEMFEDKGGDSGQHPFELHQRELFHVADKDKDGHLDHAELEFFLHPEVHGRKEEYNDMVMAEQFAEMDARPKDGSVSWDEYWGSVTQGNEFGGAQGAQLEKDEREMFKKHDKDGNGKLSKAELKKLMLPDPESINFHGPQVEHIHSVLDHDSDGHLSLDELKKNGPMVMSTLGGMSTHDEM